MHGTQTSAKLRKTCEHILSEQPLTCSRWVMKGITQGCVFLVLKIIHKVIILILIQQCTSDLRTNHVQILAAVSAKYSEHPDDASRCSKTRYARQCLISSEITRRKSIKCQVDQEQKASSPDERTHWPALPDLRCLSSCQGCPLSPPPSLTKTRDLLLISIRIQQFVGHASLLQYAAGTAVGTRATSTLPPYTSCAGFNLGHCSCRIISSLASGREAYCSSCVSSVSLCSCITSSVVISYSTAFKYW